MEFRENQPIYMQIADYFCNNILSTEWKQDEKIPSVREVAVIMEVNPNTAMRAYTYLQEKEIIYNKRGIGYFVAPEGYQRALTMRKEAFIKDDLPVIFKTMELLNLSCKEMEMIYKGYNTDNENNITLN